MEILTHFFGPLVQQALNYLSVNNCRKFTQSLLMSTILLFPSCTMKLLEMSWTFSFQFRPYVIYVGVIFSQLPHTALAICISHHNASADR